MTRDLRALLLSMTQSSTIFALTGPSALSAFRAARLLAAVRSVEKSADSLSGRFVHFIHADRPLDESERARLEALLDYGDSAKAARQRRLRSWSFRAWERFRHGQARLPILRTTPD